MDLLMYAHEYGLHQVPSYAFMSAVASASARHHDRQFDVSFAQTSPRA